MATLSRCIPIGALPADSLAWPRSIKDQLQNGLNTSDWDISKLRLNPDLNYDIRIEIPRNLAAGSRVSAKTASGKLSVSDVTGDVSATTASGKTRLSNITGTVTTTSASGSIEVTDVVGSLEANTASGSVTVNGGEAWTALRTVSGRISVDNFTMKNARLVTVSGGVRASAVVNNSVDYSVTTVSGGVNLDLTIPESSGATMTFKTASGGADVSSAWVAEGRKSWKIGNGQPGPAFNIKTVSGGLQSAAKLDPTLVLRNEPLPNTYEAETEDNEDVTVTGQGGPNADGGFDIDATIENVTGWAKDFAKEFGKGFSSATPPRQPHPNHRQRRSRRISQHLRCRQSRHVNRLRLTPRRPRMTNSAQPRTKHRPRPTSEQPPRMKPGPKQKRRHRLPPSRGPGRPAQVRSRQPVQAHRPHRSRPQPRFRRPRSQLAKTRTPNAFAFWKHSSVVKSTSTKPLPSSNPRMPRAPDPGHV